VCPERDLRVKSTVNQAISIYRHAIHALGNRSLRIPSLTDPAVMTGFYDLPPARTLVAARLAAGLDADRVSTAHPSYLLHIRHTPADSRRSVAIVTGGGSGHEPFAAGFLGLGLLDAAVPGAVFASPRASAVADACFALALTQPPPAEILAVVLNYAGDRLSFGRGVEQYRVRCPHGPTVRIVYVADDVSIPGSESPRGLAAVALLLKIVGAASEDCRRPQAVLELAQVVAKSAVTIGAALSPARLPGSSTFHSGDDTEGATESPHGRKKTMKTTSLGLGIHNEPGYEALPLAPTESGLYARELVHEICTRLEQALLSDTYIAGAPAFVVLINNLGGVSELAMSVLVGAVASYMFGDNDGEGDAEAYPLRCVADDTRVYFCAGTLVSSLDMNGMSISVLPLTTDAEGLLLAPTDAPAWPRVYRVTRQSFTAAARAAEDAIAAPESADWEDRSSSSAGRRRATTASRRVIVLIS
jgi:dihydroxyacetone kinase